MIVHINFVLLVSTSYFLLKKSFRKPSDLIRVLVCCLLAKMIKIEVVSSQNAFPSKKNGTRLEDDHKVREIIHFPFHIYRRHKKCSELNLSGGKYLKLESYLDTKYLFSYSSRSRHNNKLDFLCIKNAP